jgi:5-methylcytosine-specific restriction enzyme A
MNNPYPPTIMPRACISCGKLLYGRLSRCPSHTPKSSSGWARYAAQNPELAAFYRSAHWRERRARHLADNPTCVVCGEKATHVDHIINVASGGPLDGPIQSLCSPHHRAKTQQESKEGNKRAAARRRQGR